MADWQEEYQRKLISADEAAKFVNSGDYISFTLGREAHTIGLAIASRMEELHDVKVMVPFPGYDFGWYDPGWEKSFKCLIYQPTAVSQQMVDQKRCDIAGNSFTGFSESTDMETDIVITEVSSPDNNGFCSFGASLWNKRKHIKKGKLVLAEVNKNLIRTFGDNFIHISEIDYFVIHQSSGGHTRRGTLAGRELKQNELYLGEIAKNVSNLIKDGDTCQIGVGRTSEPLVEIGIFNDKNDIGWHSEATPRGVIRLVREGVINGRCKTINTGKVVVTSLGGSSEEDMDWVNYNPLFWLVDQDYLWDPRIISAHDNFVAINNALCVDLSGQIAAETSGSRMWGAAGGQTAFVIGAQLSKGGRSITVLPSTAKGNKVSRIVSKFEEGTLVTIPRNCVDKVVTEYGIANLKGKTMRHRAEEMIAIAHPDFRSELRKQAQQMY